MSLGDILDRIGSGNLLKESTEGEMQISVKVGIELKWYRISSTSLVFKTSSSSREITECLFIKHFSEFFRMP